MANQFTNTATKIDWDSPVTKKHIKEAKAVGLTLIGAGKDADYRTYCFNKCGHEQQIDLSTVRTNQFRCHQCLEDKLNEEAKAVGLTLIGAGRKRRLRTYRFNKCGHEQQIDLSAVRRDYFRCHQCLEDKLNEEARSVGLTLLGSGRNTNYRTYRFDDCGHEEQITMHRIRLGKGFKCNQCFQDKLNNEAKAVGLTLIGIGRTNRYRTYRFDDCGHEQDIDFTAVRKNNFICNTCEETARDLPSKVYLLKITVDTVIQSVTWLKLGYAKTVSTRIKQYGLPSDAVIEKLKAMDFETGRKAHRYEASLHTKYLRKRLPIRKMKEFMSYGHKECYPLEMLDTLMKDLEAKEKRMKKQQEI